MPELPEVETVLRTLEPLILHRTITDVWRSRFPLHGQSPAPVRLRRALVGREITRLERRGKYLLLRVGTGGALIHLGMSGQLTAACSSDPHRPHTHFTAGLGAGMELRLVDPRRFGLVEPFEGSREPEAWHALGPDPITGEFTPTVLAAALARTRRAVKLALLDQKVVAGLGNIYVAESLFDAGIHPLRPGSSLTSAEVVRLHGAIDRILRQAIQHRGTSLSDYVDGRGVPGTHQLHLLVYGRSGEVCRCCQGIIRMLPMGGRSSCYCPNCQPVR